MNGFKPLESQSKETTNQQFGSAEPTPKLEVFSVRITGKKVSASLITLCLMPLYFLGNMVFALGGGLTLLAWHVLTTVAKWEEALKDLQSTTNSDRREPK